MKETDLQSKACVVPVAIVAGLGMAGMGLASGGIVVADTTSVTDTVIATVAPSCTFKNTTDETYTGSAANGTEVSNFKDGGVHEFFLFCNNSGGYTVTATPYDLEASDEREDIIAYTDSYTSSGNDGLWTAAIASSEPGVTVTSPVPVGGGTIISSNTNSSANMSFTATYSAYVGLLTPAGTYTGTIVYTLVAAETSNSNSGNNGSNSSENSGANSGNEVTEDPNNETPNTNNLDPGNVSPSNANSGDSNSTPSNAPAMLNNTYNTYSTTNTYNTTNYSGGGGTGTTGTPVATSGDTNDTTGGTTNENSGNSSKTSDSYESPLGVTTNTSPSSEDSGIDWAPIVATGVILAAAGAGAVALARSNKEDEQEG